MILRAVPQANRQRSEELAGVFNDWGGQFGIDTPLRLAHFLSQVFVESARLTAMEENLNYSAQGLMRTWPKRFDAAKAAAYARQPMKIANYVYANRMGNGPESSGDGWNYRGRGCIMITGRSGYMGYARSPLCNGDLMAHPEWLAQSPGCYKSAMWWWQQNGCNELADTDNCENVTKRVNGGTNGLADRKYYLRRFKRELGL